MAAWFWYFVLYSFLGFLVEVVFARITHNPKRDRKCLYFLPLCPVYGLGVLLMLALPAARSNPWLLFLWAALSATGAEYLMDLFYDRVLGVSFWDYSHLPLNLHGRVCLLFSFFWGILGLIAVRLVHPWWWSWSPTSRRRSPSPPPCSWRWTSAFPSLFSAGTAPRTR